MTQKIFKKLSKYCFVFIKNFKESYIQIKVNP